MATSSYTEWDEFLLSHPNAHILQTSEWGQLKEHFGWQTKHVIDENCGAQILFRKLPLGIKLAYIPKGPIGKISSQFWKHVDDLCEMEKAFLLKIEPDCWDDETEKFDDLQGLLKSNTIQPRRTILVSLEDTEEEILDRMKQKTRYNIRLAGKKGVLVRESNDIKAFYRLIEETGKRDAFGVHSYEYYLSAYDNFYKKNKCALFLAEYENQPLAGIMVFINGNRAWYFYGASNEKERNRMPTYLLQWHAMKWAKEKGCKTYDLWGIPDEELPILEENFERRSDGLWGVYRFKRGFGGEIKRTASGYDKIYNPFIYFIFKAITRYKGMGIG